VLHILSVCICTLSYPLNNAHASYFYLWSVRIYNTFSTLSHSWQEFRRKKSLNMKSVFAFSVQCLSQTLWILRRIKRDVVISVRRCSSKVPVFFYQNEVWIFYKFSKIILISIIDKTPTHALFIQHYISLEF